MPQSINKGAPSLDDDVNSLALAPLLIFRLGSCCSRCGFDRLSFLRGREDRQLELDRNRARYAPFIRSRQETDEREVLHRGPIDVWVKVFTAWMNELWTAYEFTCLHDGVTYNHRKEALQNQLGRASAEKITQILTDESLSITMPIAKSLELFPTERAATTAAIMEAFAALHKDAAEASFLLSNMKSVIT